jgi:hypothetical protein
MRTNSRITVERPLGRRLLHVAGALACALALGAVAAPGARAAVPQFEQSSGSFTEVDTETCGFPITSEVNFDVSVQFFLDQAGNLDHSLAHIQLRGTDSANGISLAADADVTHTYDFTTGINGDLGLLAQVLVPGGGAVAFDVGRVLSDDNGNVEFVAGQHDFLFGNVSAYCDAFGG